MTPDRSQSQSPEQRLSRRDSERPAPEEEYGKYEAGQDIQYEGEPDVLLDVPVLKVEELDLELDDLRAHVSLRAEVGDLVKINVGIDAYLNYVKLQIKGVEAQALLKVRLERVLETLDRALEAIDRNPQILGTRPDAASQPSDDAAGGSASDAKRAVSDTLGEPADTTRNEPAAPVGENTAERPTAPASGQGDREATRAATKRARELGVDLSNMKGTGSGGRILVKDVIEAASQV